jgi:hypothetical protein
MNGLADGKGTTRADASGRAAQALKAMNRQYRLYHYYYSYNKARRDLHKQSWGELWLLQGFCPADPVGMYYEWQRRHSSTQQF